MKLTLERGGGVAGLRRPPLVVDTAALPADARTALEALAARVAALPAAPVGAGLPDQLGYALTIAGAGAPRTIDFAMASAPAELRELVGELRKHAT